MLLKSVGVTVTVSKSPRLSVAWNRAPAYVSLCLHILSGLQELPTSFSHYSFILAAVPLELVILIRAW